MAKSPKAKTVSTIQVGFPGLDADYGYVNEEIHPRLRGRQAMRVYEEMRDNDSTVGAALYSIEGFLRRINWKVKAAAADTDEAEADFLRSCMDDMDVPWSDTISDALSMLPFGFSLHEIIYKYRRGLDQPKRYRSKFTDGRLGWRKIDLRAQRTICRWDIDDYGDINGCWQETNKGEIYLPMSRCLLFRTKTYKNNPEGRSVLRNAYRDWHFKKRIQETEAIGTVRSLVNLPMMQIPERFMSTNATPAEKAVRASFEKIVSLVSKDQLTGLVMPSERTADDKPTGYKFDLIGSKGQPPNTDAIIRRLDSRMMMSLAAEFLMLGTEKTGSFALAAEKSSNFVRSLEWYADVLVDAFNSVAIPRLMQANGVPPDRWPALTHDPIANVDVKDLGLFLSQAGASGFMTPTLETENSLRERSNLPILDEEEYEAAREAAKPEPPPAPTPTEPAEDPEDS